MVDQRLESRRNVHFANRAATNLEKEKRERIENFQTPKKYTSKNIIYHPDYCLTLPLVSRPEYTHLGPFGSHFLHESQWFAETIAYAGAQRSRHVRTNIMPRRENIPIRGADVAQMQLHLNLHCGCSTFGWLVDGRELEELMESKMRNQQQYGMSANGISGLLLRTTSACISNLIGLS